MRCFNDENSTNAQENGDLIKTIVVGCVSGRQWKIVETAL